MSHAYTRLSRKKREPELAPAPEPTEIQSVDLIPLNGNAPPTVAGTPRLMAEPLVASFQEHLGTLTGPPLDAVQLYFRSRIPEREMVGQEDVAAAVVKTLHDLRLFEAMIPRGHAGESFDHVPVLRKDLELLDQHDPSAERMKLSTAWWEAREAVLNALPARHN